MNTQSHTIKHLSTNTTIPSHTIHFHSHFHHNTPFQPISLSQAINIKTHRITIHFIIKGVQSQSPFHSQLSLPFAIMSEDVRCVWWCEHPLRIWRGRDCVCGCFMKGDGCWLFDGRMINDDVESECWNGRWAEEEENVQEVHVPWNRSGQAAGHVP